MSGIQMIVNQDGVIDLHIVRFTVCSADIVHIVVERIDRRLGQDAGGSQQYALRRREGDSPMQAPEDAEHSRTHGRGPGVDCCKPESRRCCHPLIFDRNRDRMLLFR